MTEQQPLVSIVISCYNHEKFVQETIKSVIEQDYQNIELIIIDDGSKDDSVKVIQQMILPCEARFKRFEFRYRPNKGLCATLNEALEWCKGDFFAPTASDDILIECKVRVQVEKLLSMSKEYVGVFGTANKINIEGAFIGELNSNNSLAYSFVDIYLHRHNLPACTQMLRTSVVREVGGYSDNFKIEDWYMWLKLTENKNFLISIPVAVSQYRIHSDNTSSNTDLMHKERINIVNNNWGVDKNLKNLALAACYLSTSIESKKVSNKIKCILKALLISPKVLFEKKLYISIYRIFM